MPLNPPGEFPALEAGARKIDKIIRPMVPAGVGYTLFLYDFNQGKAGGGMTWISTGERVDMIMTLLEFLDHAMDLPKGQTLIDHVARVLPDYPEGEKHPVFVRAKRLEYFRQHLARGAGLTNDMGRELLTLIGG